MHEYIDAEIDVGGVGSPSDEKVICSVLQKLAGIQRVSISDGKVTVMYDTVLLSRGQIDEAIKTAGFDIHEHASVLASPLTDALRNSLRSEAQNSKTS